MGGSNGSGEYLRPPPRPPDGGVRIQKWGHPGFRNGDIQIQKWGSEMGTSRIKYEVIIQYYPVEHYSGCPLFCPPRCGTLTSTSSSGTPTIRQRTGRQSMLWTATGRK